MKRFFLVALILLFTTGAVTFLALLKSQWVMATENKVPDIEHPIKNPKMYSETMRCPNCGMMDGMRQGMRRHMRGGPPPGAWQDDDED